MQRWGRWALALSLIANVVLIVTLVLGKAFVDRTMFELAAMTVDAEVRLQERILTELESGDEERIESLKEYLRGGIERGKEVSSIWREAAKRAGSKGESK